MNLYELTNEFMELLQMAEDGEFDQETIADTLEGIGGEIEVKADGYAKIIKTLEGEALAYKAEIERLSKNKKAIESNATTLKKSLEKAMIATGKTKFKTSLFSFGIRKNPPSVDIVDDAIVPKMFKVEQEPRVDRKAVLDYIKREGNTAWATLKQTESLSMR